MKLRQKVLIGLAVAIILSVGGFAGWLYLYAADLPSTAQLQRFIPTTNSEVQIQFCGSNWYSTRAIPLSDVGKNLTNAVIAAEGQLDANNPLTNTLISVASHKPTRPRNMYSMQIARSLVCEGQPLRRSIDELRLANQIERRFTKEQILTAYLNRLYLGTDTYGVENASQRYYGKHSSELTVDEAALIAALIYSPTAFSPAKHPDRALQRRNLILDRMVTLGVLGESDAEKAKATGLHAKSYSPAAS